MRFRFCGDLDAPEWLMAEMAVLSRISSVRMKILSKQVMLHLLGTQIDYEKVLKLTKDTFDSASDVKAAVAGIDFILANSAKYDVDFDTLTQLTAEYLEHADDRMRSHAQHYIKDGFKRRRMRDEIQAEFVTHSAPSCFGEQSAQTIDFVDEGLDLAQMYFDCDPNDWEDEYARYEDEDEYLWGLYEIISTYQGDRPMRVLADLEPVPGVHYEATFDEDGALLSVTCHVDEVFTNSASWTLDDDEDAYTHSLHIDCEPKFKELMF